MFYSTNMKLIGMYELTAPGRRCPLWEETANETIIVLTHRTEPKDERREATIAARMFCASFGLLDVNVAIGDMRCLKLKISSTVGDGEPSLGCLDESGISNHRDSPQLEMGSLL